ncbi:hypothetical protein COLO4_02012 [Corchorus olitorius]|uniref:Uncharacterized protein n=1 Tax=Corchorus olitorius TaxID=93759 RepID=A0A1R3L1T1_9ROSI|nr:hypothetical protein COLO4_02012 [Corchorus olitorius]
MPGTIPARKSWVIDTDQTAGTRNIVTGLRHHRDQDRRECGGIRRRRTGDRRHDDGGNDGNDAETAANMADQRNRKVDDAARQTAGIHQFTGQDEEGNGEQREGIGAGDHVLGDDRRIEHAHVPHQHDAAEHQRKGNGNADGHGAEKRADKNQKCHVSALRKLFDGEIFTGKGGNLVFADLAGQKADHAENAPAPRQEHHQRFDAHMAVFAEGDDRTDEGDPDEEIARQFFRDVDAGIHGVAHDHIDEDHDCHACKKRDENGLEDAVKKIDDFLHLSPPENDPKRREHKEARAQRFKPVDMRVASARSLARDGRYRSPRFARLRINAVVPKVHSGQSDVLVTQLISLPNFGLEISTRSPLAWVKPRPGP